MSVNIDSDKYDKQFEVVELENLIKINKIQPSTNSITKPLYELRRLYFFTHFFNFIPKGSDQKSIDKVQLALELKILNKVENIKGFVLCANFLYFALLFSSQRQKLGKLRFISIMFLTSGLCKE